MPAQDASTRDSSFVQDFPLPEVLSNTLRLLFVEIEVLTDSEGKEGRDNLF